MADAAVGADEAAEAVETTDEAADDDYSDCCEDDDSEEDSEDSDSEEYAEAAEAADDGVPSGGFFNKHDEENNEPREQRESRNTRKLREQQETRERQSKQSKQSKQSQRDVFLILKRIPQKPINLIKKIKYNFYKKYNNEEKGYFDSLTKKEKDTVSILEDKLEASRAMLTVPMRFKILDLDINVRTKRSIIFKLETVSRMSSTSGEYHKINNWLSILNEIPFNRYYNIPVRNTDGNEKICVFLSNIRERMNTQIYGHKDAKEQIIRVLAQLISFPKANGYIIGIQGAAGIGKTKLIKEGICNALNYPNAFISLSGTDDASFLRGAFLYLRRSDIRENMRIAH